MATINPSINFNGNAEEASTFYKSVFGGEFAIVARFKDMASAEYPVADADAEKIMHIALPIGPNVLMGNDVPSCMGKTNENENRSKISVNCASKEDADKIFTGLSAGGNVEMPIGDSPWGSYFAMFRDLAFTRKQTYGDFLKSEEGIATNILASRLRALEDAKIIKKFANKTDRHKDFYKLTKEEAT